MIAGIGPIRQAAEWIDRLPPTSKQVVMVLVGAGVLAAATWPLRLLARFCFDHLILRRRVKISGASYPRRHTSQEGTYIVFHRIEISAPRTRGITIKVALRMKEHVAPGWIHDLDQPAVATEVPGWVQMPANHTGAGLLKFPVNIGPGESVSGYVGFRIWDSKSPLPESRKEAWLIFTESRSGIRVLCEHLKLEPILSSTL